ncbi:MAG: chorismate synthase [Paludibacteraceae bacterium]|nr:chorismate synthase [Paludibacteraceae bacterium]
MNTFGEYFSFTSFGESHGKAVGGVVDGVQAGTLISLDVIREMLARRSGRGLPGVSPRAAVEPDQVEWLSGVIEEGGQWVALGTPIAFLIRNQDARSQDYAWLRHSFRPGHADYTYQAKYGLRDYRGGGRASARETAARVAAGAIAKQLLADKGITIRARLLQVGQETDPVKIEQLLQAVQAAGDSIGGIVGCVIEGLPAGVGEPLFDKLQARLAAAMMSINGCHGFDYGFGFDSLALHGSDLYEKDGQPVDVLSPQAMSGGIAGGISDGTTVRFRCLFKPAATIRRLYGGRHDCCIAVRAVPVVEAMTALTIQDFLSSE